MADTLFYVVLISGFFVFGVVSLIWPETLRRFNFGFIRLALPKEAQLVITRFFGALSILFSLVIVWVLLRS